MYKKLFFSMAACAALVACSSDDAPNMPDNQNTGQESYIAIQLANVGGPGVGKMGAPASRVYENGDASESEVKDVTFYFYTSNGNYWGKSDVVTSFTWTQNADGNNITKTSNVIAVIHGLPNQTSGPKYVVALVNAPTNVGLVGLSLEQAYQLKDNIALKNADGNFVMVNSTYENNNAASKHFATPVTEANILKKKPTKDELTADNCVTVYVERLATKATLSLDFKAAGDKNIQALDNDGTIVIGNYDVNGDKQDVKITIDGWDVNQAANVSYLVKNVTVPNDNSTWTNTWWKTPASDYRSFWGSSANTTDDQLVRKSILVNNNNVLVRAMTNATNGTPSATPLYNMENMNVDRNTMATFLTAAPGILVSAHITSVANGVEPNWYRYQGNLYDETHFMSLILAQFHNLYSDQAHTTPLDKDDFLITPTTQGKCNVILAQNVNVYDANGESMTITVADRLRDAFQNVDEFYQGNMYYNIPIKHLNEGLYRNAEGAFNGELPEGSYGMVRNHVYKVAINSIWNLGSPVNNDDPITPDEKEEYYIGANINILAWHVVSQGVDL